MAIGILAQSFDPEQWSSRQYELKYLKEAIDATPSKSIVVHLTPDLGNWLSDHKFGQNLYDSQCSEYLWECPKEIIQAMLLYFDGGGSYAGMTLVDFIDSTIGL